MKYQDLSEYDLSLIRSNSIDMFVNTRVSCRIEALAECTLTCIYAKGFDIKPYPNHLVLAIKDELRRTIKTENSFEIIEAIFKYINDSGLQTIRSEREAYWPLPRPSWYVKYDNPKKPWMF